MDPLELQGTIYLGDRGVKRIILDGWERSVKIQIDSISRIRSPDGLWHFYTDEDIEDGFLVFGAAESCTIEPPGAIPNDYVNSFEVSRSHDSPGKYHAVLRTAGPMASGEYREVIIRVIAGGFHLEDPRRPGEQIRT